MGNDKTDNKEGGDARSRLVSAALKLFAEKGYEGASTRLICEAANVNISAIRYYFGDKAGLYRAAFTEPMGETRCGGDVRAYADMPLPELLRRFFTEFLEPFKKGEELKLVMKLHFREMVEPTGAWQQEIDAELKPQHDALVSLLQKHLQLEQADTDLHRLAFAIVGMVVHFYVGQDILTAIDLPLVDTPEAIDTLADRLSGFALSMIEGEAARRRQSLE
ncbi:MULTISPECIES: CerR family C-terminal domain-containing protein [Methylomonas]|uniref:CerR family C-terminal domain-containing protein n=1 Tax=Methylomonas TaxID=416 RepID=UPI0012320F56|nr:CerR family C-terminal domain-containing protein [Methylomonas rhizoryzae]